MLKDERKYQSRVMSNEWNTITSEQGQMIPLKAQLAFMNSFKKLKEYPAKTKKIDKILETMIQPEPKFTGAHAWRDKNPLPQEPNTKVINGGIWHYCNHNQAWGTHSKECCLKVNSERSRNNNHMPPTTTNLHIAMANLGINDITISSESESE
jgi:hypothetical protein